MKKTLKFVIIPLLIITFIASTGTQTIKTTAKTYNAGNDSVTTRELALLAALAYENVPDDRSYSLTTAQKNQDLDCFTSSNSFKKSNCFYKAINNEKVKLTSGETVYRYIEGMSERKANSLVSTVTKAPQEDGEKYYFLNFAHAKELEDKGWKIYDYANKEAAKDKVKKLGQNIFKDDINWEGIFSVVTFKKGNNYVIAYRGTDYPDLLEWLQDVAYAIEGKHAEATLAYFYAQEVYDKIIKENPNAKIYVTGHSLGGYLAQVGGAAIIDKEAGKTYTPDSMASQKQYQSFEEYKADYYKKKSNLEQVAYFNGMGIDGIFSASDFSVQVQNALVYLSKYEKDGSIATGSSKNLSYSNNSQSSGRLVLYSIDGDPVSSIGFHFGEIYKLEAAADAIANHRRNHTSVIGVAGDTLVKLIASIDTSKQIGLTNMLTSIVKDIVEAQNAGGVSNASFLPKSVMNQIEKENGNSNVVNYGLGSILENLSTDLSNFASTYNLYNLFDHFNINHETDSFACIRNTTNGSINNIELSISSDNFTCEGTTCYTNKIYSDNLYKINIKTPTKQYTGNNIRLTAKIDGACAKTYDWYYYKNGQPTYMGTTADNSIIIPDSLFSNLLEGTKKYDFYVVANYGDKFTELKATFPAGKNKVVYQRSTTYPNNPTINDGISGNASYKSKNISVTLITDRTKPSCSFNPSTQKEQLKCILGICKNRTVNATLKCTDNLSGFNSQKLSIDSFDTSNVGLIPSIKLTKDINTTVSGTNLTTTVGVKLTRIPTSLTPKVTYKGTIKDKVGNSTTITKTVNFKISKKK